MSKIVTAINAMLSNVELITSVIRSREGDELFFKYDNKFNWSISHNIKNEFYLHYYPGSGSIVNLATMPSEDVRNFSKKVSYNSKTLGTKEARESLAELYSVVQEQLFGMDKVLDEIIENDFF